MARQVIISLLVTVLAFGIKITALKDFVQTYQRTKELEGNLDLLQRRVEDEELVAWLGDGVHDNTEREKRVSAIVAASNAPFTSAESDAIEKGIAMFAAFDGSSAGVKQLKHSATIDRLETRHDVVTGLLLGRAEAVIRATPLDLVAYCLNYDSRHNQSTWNPNMYVASKVLRVGERHVVIFNRAKLGAGLSDRTFLNTIVAKRTSEDHAAQAVYILVALPIPSHDLVTPKDEKGAVRAENCRVFRFTEVASRRTKVEYLCMSDLGGRIPHFVTNSVVIPAQLGHIHTLHCYFQQLVPLAECNAEDGRVVGNLLMDLVRTRSKDRLDLATKSKDCLGLAHAIRTFAAHTTMLRECGFRHIGDMFVALFTTDIRNPTERTAEHAAIFEPDPALVTQEQARAVGSSLALMIHRSAAAVVVGALDEIMESYAVLRTMKLTHVWFLSVLDAIITRTSVNLRRASAAGLHRLASFKTQASWKVVPEQPQATVVAATVLNVKASVVHDGDSFTSVVRARLAPKCHRNLKARLWFCASTIVVHIVQVPASSSLSGL
jgi:hypothetical protein